MSSPAPWTLAAALLAAVPTPRAAAGAAPPAGDVHALLLRADAYRLPEDAMQVTTQIETLKDGQPDKERRYVVFTRPGRRSLVLSRSPAEKGQKVLMLGDDFWIVLPSSQRPIRITPLQKLLGEASAGDVATMTWADDYAGELAGEVEVAGTPCLRLELRAQRPGATYARIVLDLARADARPVQADLYVASDRLAKHATFELGRVAGRSQVVAMTLDDRIQTSRRTVIRYLARAPRSLDPAFYNPMYLTRNDPE